MTIILNGEPHSYTTPKSVSALLSELHLTQPHIAVAINGRIVPRSQFDTVTVKDADRVDIVHAVGGG